MSSFPTHLLSLSLSLSLLLPPPYWFPLARSLSLAICLLVSLFCVPSPYGPFAFCDSPMVQRALNLYDMKLVKNTDGLLTLTSGTQFPLSCLLLQTSTPLTQRGFVVNFVPQTILPVQFQSSLINNNKITRHVCV